MNNSIYGLYIPDDPIDKKEKVLFLLREPGTPYDPYNSNSNHQWWNDVKCGVQGKRYSNAIRECLKLLLLEPIPQVINEISSVNIFYGNVFPWGGGSRRSAGYKKYIRGGILSFSAKIESINSKDYDLSYDGCVISRLEKIVDASDPSYIFTCYDIFDLLVKIYHLKPQPDGILYEGHNYSKKKRVAKISFKGHSITLIEIYHPTCRYKLSSSNILATIDI